VAEKPFIISALVSLAMFGLWVLAFMVFGTSVGGGVATILIACLGLVVGVSVLVASAVFQERKLLAVCGALAGSCIFLSVIAVFIAWHHHVTTGP